MQSDRGRSPLRIALFTYSTKPRGSVIHTLELAEALHHLGHYVCIYALDKDGRGFDRSLQCQQQLIPALPVVGDIEQVIHQRIHEFVDFLEQDFTTHAYDYYHAQDCISANALVQLRQQQLIPHFVRTVHHVEDFNSPYLQHCQERSIYEPNLCLCVSEYWQHQLQQHYQILALRVKNGVNRTRFFNIAADVITEFRQRFGLSGSPIYLTVGGIEPRKNSITLLQAFSQVLNHLPQAQLVIAGGATLFDYQPYRDQFFAQAEHLQIKIGQSLILPGVISDADLPSLYRAADAFVFPSLKEGWGLVVLEAIASQLPIMVSDQPPFTEFLTPQQALFVDPHSSDAIAAAMLNLTRPHVTQSLIHQSQILCDQYTWESAAQLHLTHYRTLSRMLLNGSNRAES
jgi:glycosyltransferase-like protein